MLDIRFEDKTISVPTEWYEITVGYFIKSEFLSRDSIGLICALTGIERSVLLNSTENIMPQLNKMVEFYAKEPEGYKGKLKKYLKFRGKKISIPQDIELERLGQKILFSAALGKYTFPYQAIPEVIAIYIIPQLTDDGSFDDSLIDEVAEEVKLLPITQVYPIADFFLANLKALRKNGTQF